MKHEITTLPNGLRVVTIDMPGAQSVTAAIAVGVGSRYEDYRRNGGVSHFLEHLLFKGTKKRPSTKVISEQVDAVGGYQNAYTDYDITYYFIKVPAEHRSLALDILSDMLTDSLLDPEEVDRERNVIIEEMNVYRDDPARFVHELTPALLWPNQPIGREIIGSEEVIRAVPREDIAAFHAHFYNPENMVVVVAGKADHKSVVDDVAKLMGHLGKKQHPAAVVAENKISSDKVVILTKDTAQNHLVIGSYGYPYQDQNDPASKVVATILGRGLSSRLFLNVRERKGLAYSVSASMHNFTDTGMFSAYAGVNLDKTTDAIAAILEELERIQTEPVAEGELQKAKNQIKGGLLMSLESNSSVADRYGSQLILLSQIEPVEDTIAKIEAVSAGDVQRVASQMLAADRLRMGIISPDPEPAQKAFEKLVGGK